MKRGEEGEEGERTPPPAQEMKNNERKKKKRLKLSGETSREIDQNGKNIIKFAKPSSN